MKVKRKTSELHKRSFQNDAKEVIHQIFKKKNGIPKMKGKKAKIQKCKKGNSQNEEEKKAKLQKCKKGISKMKQSKGFFCDTKNEFSK